MRSEYSLVRLATFKSSETFLNPAKLNSAVQQEKGPLFELRRSLVPRLILEKRLRRRAHILTLPGPHRSKGVSPFVLQWEPRPRICKNDLSSESCRLAAEDLATRPAMAQCAIVYNLLILNWTFQPTPMTYYQRQRVPPTSTSNRIRVRRLQIWGINDSRTEIGCLCR